MVYFVITGSNTSINFSKICLQWNLVLKIYWNDFLVYWWAREVLNISKILGKLDWYNEQTFVK